MVAPLPRWLFKGGQEAILGFAQPLPEDTFTVTVEDVEDSSGVPIDTTHNQALFVVNWDEHPYLTSVRYLGSTRWN